MNQDRLRELWAAPELALLPPMLAALDALLASLHAQHPTLEHEWTDGDPPTLLEARLLAAIVLRARRAVAAYRSTVRRSLRDYRDDHDSDDLPF